MSSQLLWWVNDQNPAYADTITINGVAQDLSAKAAQFKMRAVGSSTLKVNQPVTTKDALGNFTYAWGATDLDAASQYLVWVEVTSSGKVQTLYEALIEVRSHANANIYAEVEQLKSTLQLTGQVYADQDLKLALSAASRAVDHATGRRFWLDTGTANARYYTPDSFRLLQIDDAVAVTTVKVDRTGDGVYEETWANGAEFVLEPANAPNDFPARPWEMIRTRRFTSRFFPVYVERGVEVTGQFGWAAVPDDIKAATTILAAKLFKRSREAVFGIVTVGIDQGVAMRIARTDPDVANLINDYSRRRPFA